MSAGVPLVGETWRSRVLPYLRYRVDAHLPDYDGVRDARGIRLVSLQSARVRTLREDIFLRHYEIAPAADETIVEQPPASVGGVS